MTCELKLLNEEQVRETLKDAGLYPSICMAERVFPKRFMNNGNAKWFASDVERYIKRQNEGYKKGEIVWMMMHIDEVNDDKEWPYTVSPPIWGDYVEPFDIHEQDVDLLFGGIAPEFTCAQAVEIIRRTLCRNGETLIITTVPPLDSDPS